MTGKKGIVFYTDNALNTEIADKVKAHLKKISKNKNIPIVCVSLKKMDFGDKNICFPRLKRGVLTLFKQQLAGVENSTADILFFCEHDVLYHPSHFNFVPPTDEAYYYNVNVRLSDGHGLRVNDCKQTSGLCAYRHLLLEHYQKLIFRVLLRLFVAKIFFSSELQNLPAILNSPTIFPADVLIPANK